MPTFLIRKDSISIIYVENWVKLSKSFSGLCIHICIPYFTSNSVIVIHCVFRYSKFQRLFPRKERKCYCYKPFYFSLITKYTKRCLTIAKNFLLDANRIIINMQNNWWLIPSKGCIVPLKLQNLAFIIYFFTTLCAKNLKTIFWLL